MTQSDDHRLADIRNAAGELALIVGHGRGAFDNDPVLRRAAERLLEIIGEAANLLGDDTTARYPQVPWHDIVRLRIVLAHHYHRVDPEQVWTIATTDVPELAAEIKGNNG